MSGMDERHVCGMPVGLCKIQNAVTKCLESFPEGIGQRAQKLLLMDTRFNRRTKNAAQ